MNTTDKFLQAYIVAALWSSMDESTPQGGYVSIVATGMAPCAQGERRAA